VSIYEEIPGSEAEPQFSRRTHVFVWTVDDRALRPRIAGAQWCGRSRLLRSGMELIRKHDYDFFAVALRCCLKGAV
jgi:hypothetical protein